MRRWLIRAAGFAFVAAAELIVVRDAFGVCSWLELRTEPLEKRG